MYVDGASNVVKVLNMVVTLENECIEHVLVIDHCCGFPVALCKILVG